MGLYVVGELDLPRYTLLITMGAGCHPWRDHQFAVQAKD